MDSEVSYIRRCVPMDPTLRIPRSNLFDFSKNTLVSLQVHPITGPLPSEERTIQKGVRTFTCKPRPESGLDCHVFHMRSTALWNHGIPGGTERTPAQRESQNRKVKHRARSISPFRTPQPHALDPRSCFIITPRFRGVITTGFQ